MNRLLIFAKYPRAGEVKTRLVPPLTYQQAADLYRAFLLDAVERYVGVDEAIESVVYLAGSGKGEKRERGETERGRNGEGELSRIADVRAQRGSTLGERMEHAFGEALRDGCEVACAIGTDLPTLPTEYVRLAFAAMREHDIAIGPADDGGYYLLCMKRLHAALFRDMEFSTPTVFAETMRRAERDGLTIAVLPHWYDVDDEASLRRLWDEREMLPENSRTRQVLKTMNGVL